MFRRKRRTPLKRRRVTRRRTSRVRRVTGPRSARATVKGGMRIRNREFVRDVHGTVSFESLLFKLQVADPITFPWLSQIARSFEEWVPKSIRFEFRSLASSTSGVNTTALGSVVMATDYNSYNPPFVGKAEMENYSGAQSCKPSVSMKHFIKTGAHRNPLGSYYTNDQLGYPAGADIRMYDIGNFQFATVGQPSVTAGASTTDPIVLPIQGTGVIGELWVSYDIEFRKPKTRGTSMQANHAHWKGLGLEPNGADCFGAIMASGAGVLPLNEGLQVYPDYASSWPNNNRNLPVLRTGEVGGAGTAQQKGEYQKITFPVGVERGEVYGIEFLGFTTDGVEDLDFQTVAAGWTLGNNLQFVPYYGANSSAPNQGAFGTNATASELGINWWATFLAVVTVVENCTAENQSNTWIRMPGQVGKDAAVMSGGFDLKVYQMNQGAATRVGQTSLFRLTPFPTD